jgi:predicted RNase H-like nuclease
VTVFVGVDLAWGTRNPSGICVIGRDGCFLDCRVATVAELASIVDALGDNIVAGIDAPLIVEPGRCAESVLARRMGRCGVYAHSSTAALNAGYDQGVRLARALEGVGFSLQPSIPPGSGGRYAFEAYPHAGHVVMFGLPRIMPYKQKRGRTALSLNAELQRYRDLASGWIGREFPTVSGQPEVRTLLETGALAGAARKRHEDQLDALTCALLAMVAWRDGLGADDVLGDDRGYIAVPGLSRDPRFAQAAVADGVH